MEKAVAEISVLLVEDERSHANLILRAFSRHQGKFRIQVATGFEEAKRLLDLKKPEVLISDLLLPGLSRSGR
jgi:DNA-binding response OmpR family regulator